MHETVKKQLRHKKFWDNPLAHLALSILSSDSVSPYPEHEERWGKFTAESAPLADLAEELAIIVLAKDIGLRVPEELLATVFGKVQYLEFTCFPFDPITQSAALLSMMAQDVCH